MTLRHLLIAAWLLLCGPAFAVAPPIPPCLPDGPCLPGYTIVPGSRHLEEGLEYTPDMKRADGSSWPAGFKTYHGRHYFQLVEDSAGVRTWSLLSCSFTGNDCNYTKWGAYRLAMLALPESLRRGLQELAWANSFDYTCDEATRKVDGTAPVWQRDVCIEQHNIFAKYFVTWHAALPAAARYTVAYNSACPAASKLAGTCTRPVSIYNPATKTIMLAKAGVDQLPTTVAVGAPCFPDLVTYKATPTSTVTYMAIDRAHPDRVAVCALVKG